MLGKWRFYRLGGIAISIIMLAAALPLFEAATGGGMFGAGGMMGGESDAPSSATAISGGPFTSGGVTIGKGGMDTQTIMIIAGVALVALFLLKRK